MKEREGFMQKMYRLFGLTVSSCIDIPEAVKIDGDLKPDVCVCICEFNIKKYLPENYNVEDFFMTPLTRNHIVFSCPAGIYEIREGRTINIMPKEGVSEAKIRVFLLGSAMGAIQIQRGYIPLHGGAIVSNNKAVIISGQSGTGKSTMTSALVSLGYKYLTDDVSSTVFGNEKPFILPAYPQRKLIRDACTALGFNPERLPIVDIDRDKFAIRDRALWCDNPKELALLVVLEANHENDEVESSEIIGVKKLAAVVQSLYRKNLHYVEGDLPPDDFKKILQITSQIRGLRISIPRKPEKILDNAKKISIVIENCTCI